MTSIRQQARPTTLCFYDGNIISTFLQNCFEFTWALIGEITFCNRSKDFVGLVPWALSFLQTVVLKQVMPKIEVLGLRRLHTEGVQPINKQATLCNLVRDY